ncbi:MAG: hypothetical protein LC104_20290 [Bacteroidales bacterium]|nr:hypothetical protein [Bacteroidales bacterium]
MANPQLAADIRDLVEPHTQPPRKTASTDAIFANVAAAQAEVKNNPLGHVRTLVMDLDDGRVWNRSGAGRC